MRHDDGADTAVSIIECAKIARGLVVVDAAIKKAPVTVHLAQTVSPGHFLMIMTGPLAALHEAHQTGLAVAGTELVGETFIASPHLQVLDALFGKATALQGEAAGIVEMAHAAACVVAADAALKCADVSLSRMHLATGIGGKGFFVVSGKVADVQAALDAAAGAAGEDAGVSSEVIAQIHDEARAHIAGARS